KLIDMPGDGEYEWVADGNMDAGTVVTLDLSIDTGNLGSFNAFAIQGDQLFAIQGTTDNPSFIAGLHFNIKKNLNNDPTTIITDDLNWDGEPSIDNQGNPIRNDESALPDDLVTGDTAVRLFYNDSNLEIESNNFQFSCEKAGEDVKGCKEELRKILHNSDNWDTNNSVGFSNLNESACPITLTNELTVTGLTGNNKIYDGTTYAIATGTAVLSGVNPEDDVFLGGSPVFTFASSSVGTGVVIITSGYTLSGQDAENYKLTQPTLSGDITAKELTITGITGSDKVYDDTTAATATGTFTLNGVESGDDVILGGSPVFTFASANVGTGITINTTGLTISGTDSGNYTLTQPILSGDITAKELTITGITGDNKVIDCLPNATVTGTASISGVISDDDILLGGNPAFMFVSVQVGADITINTIGYTISGTDSGNYTLTQPMLSADILVPSAMCQDIEVALNDSGQITILPIDIDNESYIGCGWSLKSVSPNTFFCNDIGTNIVTLTIGDENGNISTCQSTVTVFDNAAPTVTVNQDIIAELDENGTVIIKNLRDVVPVVSASDNCEVKSIFIKGGKKNRTFTCNDIATNPNIRIIRVKDVNGNKTDIPVNIIVQDNIDPIPLANDIVVQLDDNGVVSVNPNDLDNGSSDNCEIASFNLSKSNFTCNDIGNNVVTFSVTDVNGNTANTLVNIEVIGIELDYEYQDVTCFGLDDGMITLNYITPGAIVTVNNEIYDPNKLYPAGTYNIKAFYDSDNTTNCVVEESIEILEPENVTVDVTTTAVTCSGEIDGTITVSNLSAGAVYTIKKNGIGEDLSNQIYFEPGFYVVRAFLPVAANNDGLFDDIFYDNTCEATAFAVVFEDNNCSDRTNSLNAIDVSVYPNPVKDILNIRFDNDVIDSDITIEVHNLVGNKMYSNTFSSKAMVQPEIKINFSKFPSHVYYVNIITQQGSVIKKIILDR
ncbi:YDG domain-containing protein, partial [Flavobacteriaceae bacterium]|nr:YDG domain-containing protein [Flavobacteriaceae bacterium]